MAKKVLVLALATVMAFTLAITASAELWVTGRTADWNAIDFKAGELADGKYTLTVTFKADSDQVFRFAQGDNPWGQIAESASGKTGTVTLDIEVADGALICDAASDRSLIRMGTPTTDDYAILSVKVTGAATINVDVASFIDLEDDHPWLMAAGSPNFDWVVASTGSGAGTTGSDEDDKQEAPTGLGDVAVASAIALLAAGAVVFARKRK